MQLSNEEDIVAPAAKFMIAIGALEAVNSMLAQTPMRLFAMPELKDLTERFGIAASAFMENLGPMPAQWRVANAYAFVKACEATAEQEERNTASPTGVDGGLRQSGRFEYHGSHSGTFRADGEQLRPVSNLMAGLAGNFGPGETLATDNGDRDEDSDAPLRRMESFWSRIIGMPVTAKWTHDRKAIMIVATS